MRTIWTLIFLLCFTGAGRAQQVLFYDNFDRADAVVRKSISTLREDLWVLLPGEMCHGIQVEGVGGVAYPVQFDSGPIDGPPEARVHCIAQSTQGFPIQAGSIYTHKMLFRINDYDAFYRVNKGFQSVEGGDGFHGAYMTATTTLIKNEKGSGDSLLLVINEPDGIQRFDFSELFLRPYVDQWLVLETVLNLQFDNRLTASSRLSTQDGTILGSINVVLTNPREIDLIRGREFRLHNRPMLYLSETERVIEFKEISLTRR